MFVAMKVCTHPKVWFGNDFGEQPLCFAVFCKVRFVWKWIFQNSRFAGVHSWLLWQFALQMLTKLFVLPLHCVLKFAQQTCVVAHWQATFCHHVVGNLLLGFRANAVHNLESFAFRCKFVGKWRCRCQQNLQVAVEVEQSFLPVQVQFRKHVVQK